MFIGLSSKIASMQVQRRMNDAINDAGQVFQRLASGQRINRASDDAAGLALSSSLRVNSRVFAQGVRNLNDGISALNIADGAVSNLSGIMERLRELAAQASNGSYSSAQRAALDKEAQELRKEYFRLASSTTFNGINLLNGALGTGLRIQSGYGASGSVLTGVGGTMGTGNFSTGDRIDVGNATAIATADVNGDGKLDMLQGNSSGTGVTVRLGNGDGTFTNGTTFSTGGDPLQIETADMNGDGRLDLGVRTAVSNVILRGNGDGTFQAAQAINLESPKGMAFADIDGDGKVDYIEGSRGKFDVFRGNGNGGFAAVATQSYSFAFSADRVDFKVADFSGDGRADIAVLYEDGTDGVVEGLFQNQNGSFQSLMNLAIGRPSNQIEIADLNNDGRMDLAVADAGNLLLDTYLTSSSGFTLTGSTQLQDPLTALKAGDFNSDGNADLLGFSASPAVLFIGRGNGLTESSDLLGGPSSAIDQTVTGDFNGDGAIDFLGRSGNRIFLSTNLTQEGINPLQQFSLLTLADARQALSVFAQTAENLSKQRGQIGSFQSRLEVATRTAQASSDTALQASSRITDVDVAAETANLVRYKAKQDAGANILGQMNLQSDIVLQLLRIN